MSQEAGPAVVQPQEPKKKRRGLRIFLIVVVVIVLACLALYVLLAPVISDVFDRIVEGLEDAQEFYTKGDAFLTALGEDDYEQAYALFVPELQQELGDVEALRSMIQESQAQPAEWNWTAFNLSTSEGVQTAALEGSVTYVEGREGAVALEFARSGGEWKLLSFNLTW